MISIFGVRGSSLPLGYKKLGNLPLISKYLRTFLMIDKPVVKRLLFAVTSYPFLIINITC
jgi:hypothetical protein